MLIDPAAHGGHRETDLAMLALFGCPHWDSWSSAATSASTASTPQWPQRVALHQLHPLMVHAVLFGGDYSGTSRGAGPALPLIGVPVTVGRSARSSRPRT